MSKRFSKFALTMILAGMVLMFFSASSAVAADDKGAVAAENAGFLTTDGARKLGGAIGAGLSVPADTPDIA